MDSSDFLRKSGVVKILLYFYEHPEGKIKTNAGIDLKINPTIAFQALKVLENAGVFSKKISTEGRDRILLILNEKGNAIASRLKEIDRILAEDLFLMTKIDPDPSDSQPSKRPHSKLSK
jgi:DNA-binding MarR family transcriptional regulator